MTDRLAVLIGVASCDRDLFPAIPHVVAADVARMSEALATSDYTIRYCGVGDAPEAMPSRNRIRAAIMDACDQVAEGGILLVYFSGHGVVIDGKSYLVPQDPIADRNGSLDAGSLVPIMPPGIEYCRAKLVVFYVDACREDQASLVVPPRDELPLPASGDFALVSSCAAGQLSSYTDTGSHFTQALADVLGRRNPARTVDEVFDRVVRRLAATGLPEEDGPQTPKMAMTRRAGPGSKSPGAIVICEGERVSEQWRTAVTSSTLWNRATCRPEVREQACDLVVQAVEAAAVTWLDAHAHFTSVAGFDDPWAPYEVPVRVLACAEKCLPESTSFTAVEVAMMIAAPFLREVTYSAGIRLAADIQPTSFHRTYAETVRYDLEITHQVHEHVCRRAEGLDKRGHEELRNALAMWLVHRWLGSRAALWEETAATHACDQLAAGLAPLASDRLKPGELATLLKVLARCTGAEPDDPRLVERLGYRDFTVTSRLLAAVLWLGGSMAADPRRMPPVIVDHLGVGSDLTVPGVHDAARSTRWDRTTDAMELGAICDHPAIHDALTDVVARAQFVRERLGAALDVATELPGRFGDAGLRAELRDGVPVYVTPLLRFQLSEDKVRELLMGRQLYGEPELAIRELYQNALDACRYRSVRRRYLRRTNQRPGEWQGLIEFGQGRTADGREYIECTDNGVGMDRETLEKTFANAGERFIYRAAFRQEQADWQELTPPLRLVPNSQFGVGVFSYFMLAEEIEIFTRPVNRDDLPMPTGFRVSIASSGSLFRITETTEAGSGGTRVRLYLTGEDDVSVVRTMRDLLRVAEFRVEVNHDGIGRDAWQPDELHHTESGLKPLKVGDDFWWVPGEGCLAADGIATAEERYGFLVNLREARLPQFTVDRKSLRRWDRKWVAERVRSALPELMTWPGLSLSWLWEVAKQTPDVAHDIFQWLSRDDRELRVEGAVGHGVLAPVSRVGCLSLDARLLSGELFRYGGDDWLVRWRLGVWRDHIQLPRWWQASPPEQTDGLPVVDPFEAEVIDALYEGMPIRRRDAPSPSELLAVAAKAEQAPAARLSRLRRFAIVGVDLTAARDLPRIDRALSKEEIALLPAVAAWARPGEPARVAVGGPLAAVSHAMRAPLRTVIDRVSRLVPAGWVPPLIESETLYDYVFNAGDVRLFHASGYTYAPVIEATVPPSHVATLATALNQPVSEILQRFDRFAALGYRVEARDAYPDEITATELETLRDVHTAGQSITSFDMFFLAGRRGCTVERLREELARLSASGLIRLPEIDPVPDQVPTSDQIDVMRQAAQGRYDIWNGGYHKPDESHVLVSLVTRLPASDDHRFTDELAIMQPVLEIMCADRHMTPPEVVSIAHRFDYSLAETIDFLTKVLPGSDVLGDLSTDFRESTISLKRYDERIALLGSPYSMRIEGEPVHWCLDARSLVQAALAGRQTVPEIIDRVAPFAEFGAPVPHLDDAERASMLAIPVTPHDSDMLVKSDGYGDDVPITEFRPFDLVRIAGRYGWTLQHADARLRRFAPLGLTLHFDTENCADQLVSWQDLLALTTHLDGQPPTLSGPVTDDHLAAAADAVGEPVGGVRERLRPYANLIGFTLPVMSTEETSGA